MSGSSNAGARRVDKRPANIRKERWRALLKSLLLPMIVLVLFAAGPHWLNSKLCDEIVKEINASAKLSPAERDDRIATFSKVDFAAVCRDDSPDFAALRAALVRSGVARTYEYLHWGLICSSILMGVLLVTTAILLTFNQAAQKSQADLIHYYRLGWKVTMASTFLQVLLLIPLLTYAAYEFPVLWMNQWSPKLVIVVPFLGLIALWRSVSILFKNIPLRFNEPMSRRITPEQAPELWQAVRIAAARLGTAPPDNIIIGLQLNFYVTELDVWDGHELAKGRTLYLSYPLLKQLPEEEIIAVIGHELGHFIGEDTRMTREFYPMRLKAHATLVSLAQAVYVGWTSLQFLNFFGWCFGETEQAASRKRELLADKKAVALTSPGTAARALVRFHVLLEAFQQGLVDAVRKGTQSPLDVSLHTVVSEKLPAGATFWAELFEKKLPHPLDSHPTLHVRLEALGQNMDAHTAMALTTQETESAYSRWFVNRDDLFADLRRQGEEVVQKMRSKAKVIDADYSTPEGRELLNRHFPEKQWQFGQSSFWFMLVLLGILAVGCWSLALFLNIDGIEWIRVGSAVVGLVMLGIAVQHWVHHHQAVLTLNAEGLAYTGWKRQLRFREVEHLSGRNTNGIITLTFRFKEPQSSPWKYPLIRRLKTKVTISLNGLVGAKQVSIAQDIIRYYTRHIPD